MTNVIKMFYELRDANSGEILEENTQNEVGFLTGCGQILEALEEQVIKMSAGQSATFVIPCAQAMGEYEPEAFQMIPKEQFAGIELVEGMELFGEGTEGDMVRVIVREIGESEVKIDFNHPYAGLDLEFEVTVTENREATPDELASGRVEMPHACGCGGGGHGGCGGHGHGGHGGCGCGGHGGHGHGGHEEDEDECCGGSEHANGGCCGRHKH